MLRSIIIITIITVSAAHPVSKATSREQLQTQADAHFDREQFEDAIKCYKQILGTRFSAGTAFRLGFALHRTGQTEQAIELYTMLDKKYPNICEITYNTAYMYRANNQPHKAIPYYLKTIQLDPSNEDALYGLSKCYLALGNFEDGFNLFEWRFNNAAKHHKQSNYRHLTEHDFCGKRVFVRAEAWGLGDYLHFIRYARKLKESGAHVIAQTLEPLRKLISLCPYIDTVITDKDPFPECDIQIPLLSLPFVFKTTLQTVPNSVPYLYADSKLVEHWKKQLENDRAQLKIGLYWHGHKYFEAFTFPAAQKTIPLMMLLPLLQIPNVSFYSLQAVDGIEQLKELPANIQLHQFENFDTTNGRFMDSAALIKNLDLIITVDTSIAHLAGGLGIPVWVLLPRTAEWRWMLDRSDSPWYPTMRLFRQKKPADWQGVVDDLCVAVQDRIKQVSIR